MRVADPPAPACDNAGEEWKDLEWSTAIQEAFESHHEQTSRIMLRYLPSQWYLAANDDALDVIELIERAMETKWWRVAAQLVDGSAKAEQNTKHGQPSTSRKAIDKSRFFPSFLTAVDTGHASLAIRILDECCSPESIVKSIREGRYMKMLVRDEEGLTFLQIMQDHGALYTSYELDTNGGIEDIYFGYTNHKICTFATFLHHAAVLENPGAIFFLAEHMPVNARDSCYHTPLDWAAGWGQDVRIMEILLHLGANANKPDLKGRRALYWAMCSRYDSDRKVVLLLDALENKWPTRNASEAATEDRRAPMRRRLRRWFKARVRWLPDENRQSLVLYELYSEKDVSGRPATPDPDANYYTA